MHDSRPISFATHAIPFYMLCLHPSDCDSLFKRLFPSIYQKEWSKTVQNMRGGNHDARKFYFYCCCCWWWCWCRRWKKNRTRVEDEKKEENGLKTARFPFQQLVFTASSFSIILLLFLLLISCILFTLINFALFLLLMLLLMLLMLLMFSFFFPSQIEWSISIHFNSSFILIFQILWAWD